MAEALTTIHTKVLHSELDASINFIITDRYGMLEARYVNRGTGNFIVYLSSMYGCDQSCRMCHLTQTKQTDPRTTSMEMFILQAQTVLNYVRSKGIVTETDKVYFDFMARGEPLLNPHVVEWKELRSKLIALVPEAEQVKFKVSTIFPKGFDLRNLSNFIVPGTRIYYSLYSMDDEFRKRWLPKSIDPELALAALQRLEPLGLDFRFHWALIDGENTSVTTIIKLRLALRKFKNPSLNLVRYNPYSKAQGRECPEDLLYIIAEEFRDSGVDTKVVVKVGPDVKASCGMFIK